MRDYDLNDLEHGRGSRFVRFQDLMKFRINNVLLVSSLYDSFILGEDGQLYEMLVNEYIGLNLSQPPGLTRVSSGREALQQLRDGNRYELIITTLRLDDMPVLEFAKQLRASGDNTALVLLTYDNRELRELSSRPEIKHFNKIFMWQGNFNILLGVIKCIEDLANVEHDTNLIGVQSIILVEDNVKFYSSYLPIIYTELLRQSQHVISEGVNLAHKLLRMRARPKILLCTNYEEAWDCYVKYHESILGIISDVEFPRNGKSDPQAGVTFAQEVTKLHPDIPILLQSFDPQRESQAYEIGASFLLKNSPTLLQQLSHFMKEYFSFGDFVFRLPDGDVVGRASDLREMRDQLKNIPDESLLFHAERNHFSNWLKARTEFLLAYKIRPQKVSDFKSVDELRQALISYLQDYRVSQQRGAIVDFDPENFDPEATFARIGGGSLGGKGRGLAFAGTLINSYDATYKFKGVRIFVPPSVILASDVFDRFMELNDLRDFAIRETDEETLMIRFMKAELPSDVKIWLQAYLEQVNYPIAVRSSSLLEDSQYQPFAGVYQTFMLPNNHNDMEIRLRHLMASIKRVYASTYSNHAKAYIEATPYRLEEEKMAVILQKLVGSSYGRYFYPDFSGVLRSHNFYPVSPMQSEEGIVSAALGLGQMVVEGGNTVRFCPAYPRHAIQFATIEDALDYSQKEFYAVEMTGKNAKYNPEEVSESVKLNISVAENDNVLGPMGSTYSRENNVIYDGISRPGMRLVTFAGILKTDIFPLSDIMNEIMNLGRKGMSAPVEIEFSVCLNVPPDQPKEFCMLQMRPMVLRHEREELNIGETPDKDLICRSSQVMGNGLLDDIHDVIVVNKEKFDRSKSVSVAQDVGAFNMQLRAENRRFVLIGVGRWGSADPWLGIPVTWDDISGASVIVESDFSDMRVTPSQGTHFFHNLNAFKIGYFTIGGERSDDFVDWDWLMSQKPISTRGLISHLRFDSPLTVKMDGHNNNGVIIKPE
jgi:CheY-like chemotaxis protein